MKTAIICILLNYTKIMITFRLSLLDALPISLRALCLTTAFLAVLLGLYVNSARQQSRGVAWVLSEGGHVSYAYEKPLADGTRSEEHTYELQSRLHLVCRLLLEKKKIQQISRT